MLKLRAPVDWLRGLYKVFLREWRMMRETMRSAPPIIRAAFWSFWIGAAIALPVDILFLAYLIYRSIRGR